MIYETSYSAILIAILTVDSGSLPLSQEDMTRLLSIIPEGEEMYLAVEDDLYEELVLATNQCGVITIERGVGRTTPRRFPKGSCVKTKISVPLIEWLICNYDCCGGDCPCETVTAAGLVLPGGKEGEMWEGSVIFKGDMPMQLGVTGLPSWSLAEHGPNYVRIYGTPNGAGTWSVSVAATNCNGRGIAIQTGSIVVTEKEVCPTCPECPECPDPETPDIP